MNYGHDAGKLTLLSLLAGQTLSIHFLFNTHIGLNDRQVGRSGSGHFSALASAAVPKAMSLLKQW